ncbi:hypothetical protein JNW90_15265 [Micromonospora sp. STR1s_5]|nr:hypothetical protein [Micromonospora sp. STR1s_5]
MLLDDFQKQHYAYQVDLRYEGVDRQRGEEFVRTLLVELGQYGREDAAGLFCQLVATIAVEHLMHGRCVFELFAHVGDDEEPSTRLGVIPGWSLRRRMTGTFQLGAKSGKLEWRKLPAASLVEFRLPGRLGKELYRTRQRLQLLDRHQPGEFAILATSRLTGYDFTTHRDAFEGLAARATRAIGWDGRDSFLREATSGYRTYRRLRFRRTWLTIVGATLETLNHIFANDDVNGGTPFKIHVNGLPTVEDIDNNIAAVFDGTKSLDDIFQTVLHPRRD